MNNLEFCHSFTYDKPRRLADIIMIMSDFPVMHYVHGIWNTTNLVNMDVHKCFYVVSEEYLVSYCIALLIQSSQSLSANPEADHYILCTYGICLTRKTPTVD